jgi:hypothetical protein
MLKVLPYLVYFCRCSDEDTDDIAILFYIQGVNKKVSQTLRACSTNKNKTKSSNKNISKNPFQGSYSLLKGVKRGGLLGYIWRTAKTKLLKFRVAAYVFTPN